MSSPLLTLDELRLPRGTLLELSTEFAPGVHVITGPNGIGKTSLLNAIAGSLPLVSGAIRLDGKALGHHDAAQVVLAPNVPPAFRGSAPACCSTSSSHCTPGRGATRRQRRTSCARLGLASSLDAAARHALGRHGAQAAAGGRAHRRASRDALRRAHQRHRRRRPSPRSSTWCAQLPLPRIVIITTHHVGDLMSLNPRVLPLATAELIPNDARAITRRGLAGRRRRPYDQAPAQTMPRKIPSSR